MGCLFAIFAGFFPRFALLVVWLARPNLVDAAFGTWIVPLLGIVFFPFATLLYVLFYVPGVGVPGWAWLWIALGVLVDLSHWVSTVLRRDRMVDLRSM
ncbi:hypothetical protein ACFFMN_01710 [Planobispora siamensis]|uniref:Uncharacterized protein n=1 Tax=Planobispora siamensis TaxID=936338 RepID=A0A8J3SK34_9ACTN|nr:hypothetical protein [Planobispora siamensis]GIH95737.1 hypothetical protein Psi01_63670 [Planobispora siamensis]